MIIVQEEIVPALSVESCYTWANRLAPTINVVRFYEALPLLHLPGAPRPQLDWDLVFRQHWDCVKCAPADVMALRQREISKLTGDIPLCIALPLEAFRTEQAFGRSAFLDIQTWISDLRPGIVTTVGDVPITDMKHLIKVFEGVRRAV